MVSISESDDDLGAEALHADKDRNFHPTLMNLQNDTNQKCV